MNLKNNKVALIAVAKDEDAYIHEWIHHHLYLGFSPIYIGVNRTSDKTLEIINKISKTEKEVYSYCLDWIDQSSFGFNNRMQNIAYSYLSTKIDKNLVDYVGYLDIDEFWFNIDGKHIQDFVEENRPFDIVSFFWLCQLAEDTEFLPPFKDVFYSICGPSKSFVKTSLLDQVAVFTPHVLSFQNDFYNKLIHIDQEGNNISKLNPDQLFNRQKPVFENKHISSCLLHRMMRSENEYLSLIFRGNTYGELIKSNFRHGFKKAHIKLPTIFGEDYYTSLNQFIETHELEETLKEGRALKLHFYKDKIENMTSSQLVAECDNVKNTLSGTIALNLFVKVFVAKVDDVDSLRDFAVSLEKIELNLSIQLMQKAHELRPLGPFIKKKLGEYQDSLKCN